MQEATRFVRYSYRRTWSRKGKAMLYLTAIKWVQTKLWSSKSTSAPLNTLPWFEWFPAVQIVPPRVGIQGAWSSQTAFIYMSATIHNRDDEISVMDGVQAYPFRYNN